MRGEPVFFGLYAKAAELEAESDEHGVTRWHVWGLPDGNFMLREAPPEGTDDHSKPQGDAGGRDSSAQRLTADEFFAEYRVLTAFNSRRNSTAPAKNRARPPAEGAPDPAPAGATPGVARRPGAAGVAGAPRVAGWPAESGGARKKEEDHGGSPALKNKAEVNEAIVVRGARRMWGSEAEPTAGHGAEAVPPIARQGKEDAAGGKKDGYENLAGVPPGDKEHYDLIRSARKSATQAHLIADAHDPAPADDPFGPSQLSPEEIANVEQAFRTEFSLALIRLKGRRDEALRTLESMLKKTGAFSVEHKFMFTDCGMALRKRRLYALANKFHERARRLAPDDEHVLFNQARAMYESGKVDEAREFLRQALEMDPDFTAGKNFAAFLDSSGKRF